MAKVLERFLRYVQIDTTSNEESCESPSTKGQLKLAREVLKELKTLGLQDVTLDDNGYVMALLPANIERNVPAVGFIAHNPVLWDY